MRVIVAGANVNGSIFQEALAASGFQPLLLLLMRPGLPVEDAAEEWADENLVQVAKFAPSASQWKTHGITAQVNCTKAMVSCAQALLAVYDGKNTYVGTMLAEARKKGLKIYVHNV